MKCPKCGAEVEKGSLYCHICLTEVPWVPEYRTVETLLHQKQAKEAVVRKEPKKPVSQKYQSLLAGRTSLVFGAAVFALLLAVFLCIFVIFHRMNSFDYQFALAVEQYEAGRFQECDRHLERALTKNPNDLDANLLLAKVMEAQGDLESAKLVMQPLMKQYEHSPRVYKEFLKILDGLGETEKIQKILEECENETILDVCSEYLCKEPEISLEEGTYTEPQTISIQSEYDRMYYTLDGSVPTQNSTRYEGEIFISEGVTELSVFCVNEKNIPSKIITRKYVIVMETPEVPKLLPEEELLHKKTSITMKVPEGCTGYYAFDQVPTSLSTIYTGPVPMPEGTHTFYAIVIGANGKQSGLACRTYTLIYD